jgi:hypothetical protein
VEEKGNYTARKTGNVAIEVDILEKSRAHLFLIAFPIPTGWHGQVIDRLDIERILGATKLTHAGRILRYPRVQTGQWENTVSALVPIQDLMRFGKPVHLWIKSLTQQAWISKAA